MRRAVLWSTAVLLGWFGISMIGLQIGSYMLVARGWDVLDGAAFITLLAALLIFLVKESWGKIVLGFFLLVTLFSQAWFTWRFFLFGASREIVDAYNKMNANTLRIFPASAERIVPDLYQGVLMLLTLAAVVVWVIYLFRHPVKKHAE